MSDVPPGYKQTEVGVIPEDWKIAVIGNVAHVTTGGRNTQDRIKDGIYPFFVRSQVVERINTYSYDGEAVLTAGDGVGTGKVFHYINGRFDVHQRVYRITEFSSDLYGRYFYLYFSSNFLNRIMQMTAKSSVDSVRMDMITRMFLPLPPLPEQRAIASALADVDALLASMEELLTKKRQLKQAAMQEMLTGKTRLKGFEGEWEEKSIGEVAPLKRGFDLPNSAVVDGMFPVVYSNGVERFHHQAMRKGPGVITGRSGTLGKVFYVESDYWPHNTTLWVTDFKGSNPSYIYLLYKYIGFNRFASGTGVPTLNRNDAHSFLISIPPLPEQQAIATILLDMDAEIDALEQRLTKTRDLKQGMMQELLTGRTRLV